MATTDDSVSAAVLADARGTPGEPVATAEVSPGAASGAASSGASNSDGRPLIADTDLNKKIATLKEQQSKLLEDRKKLNRDLRNTERKRRRLKDKAKLLSDTDILAVLRIRKEAAATKESMSASSHAPASRGACRRQRMADDSDEDVASKNAKESQKLSKVAKKKPTAKAKDSDDADDDSDREQAEPQKDKAASNEELELDM